MNTLRRKKMTTAINQLIIDGTFSVARKGKDILLVKMVSGKPVSIMLTDMGEGYWIDPPKNQFVCGNSHFEFSEPEMRCTRRKSVLMRLVASLQKTKVWDFILNKKFFVPNEANKKMNKKIIADQYDSIMGKIHLR